MENDQYSLCWDNFHKNMSNGMHSLLENEDLVDVTLAVEGQFLKAHKMVLSICSPYFRTLFNLDPHKHPIVLMTDVTYSIMSDLLTFMYQGEVEVNQENLEKFLKTAEALQIKGLTGENADLTESVASDETRSGKRPAPTEPKQKTVKKIVHASKRVKTSTPPPTPTSNVNTVTTSKRVIAEELVQDESIEMVKLPEVIQYKIEPSDITSEQNNIFEPSETFDEMEGENTMDEGSYFSNMEGDDDPKPGTSTDMMGDSQAHLLLEYGPSVIREGKRRRRRRKTKTCSGVLDHLPAEGSTRRRCRHCAEFNKERRTKTYCMACNVALCKFCFTLYHSTKAVYS